MDLCILGRRATQILYDNTKIAVAKILGREERQRTWSFSELQRYYLFANKFGRPAKGNDKGKVEHLANQSAINRRSRQVTVYLFPREGSVIEGCRRHTGGDVFPWIGRTGTVKTQGFK